MKATIKIWDSDEELPGEHSKGRRSNHSSGIVRMLNNPKYSDIVFNVGDEEIQAHKVILAANSKYFEAMFGSDMVESQSNCVKITDFEPKVIRTMLEYIYSGQLKLEANGESVNKRASFYSDLLMAADK